MMRKSVVHLLPIWILLVIALLASVALWGPGIVNTRGGGDSPFLLQRTHQLTANLREGVFPVRWMPDAAYGLGYPFFNHYSAFPFYLAALFNLGGLDLLTALKLTQTLGFIAAGLAMFAWVSHVWRNRAMAWLAAVTYTVAPFHLVNVYVRGDSLSEFYAFVWYPLILWAVAGLVKQASEYKLQSAAGFLKITALALSYAGLILTHNLSAAVFSPFVLLYLVLLVWRIPGKRWRVLGMGLGALVLGVALAAWVWMPALLETEYVQPETLTSGYFHYSNQFRSSNLIQTGVLFDYDVSPTIGGPSPFAMGGPQALLALAGIVVLIYMVFEWLRRTSPELHRQTIGDKDAVIIRPASNVFVVIGLLFSTFMITPLSRLLWDTVPLLEMVQFPWRFLSVQALFASAAIGALVLPLRRRWEWLLSGALSVVLIASTLVPLRPERLLIGPDDVTATRLQEYELFTSNIGTTIRWEWLPEAAVPRPFIFDAVIEPTASLQTIPLAGSLIEATQVSRDATEQIWHMHVGDQEATLGFPVLYWPGWQAWVDGERLAARAIEGSGYLALEVPPGEHTIHLKLGRTPLRAGSETLSLVTLLFVLGAAVWAVSRSGFRLSTGVLRGQDNVTLVFGSLLIVLVGLLYLYAQSSPPDSRPDDLTMDFVALPYLHHNPDGITFTYAGEGAAVPDARLMRYTFSADKVAPGEILTVTLKWDDGVDGENGKQVSVRLVSPAEHLPDNGVSTYTLAEDTAPLAPTTVHRLNVPDNIPRGIYLLQSSLWDRDGELSALTPSGAERGALYLRPVRVSEGASLAAESPLLALAGPDIRLRTAQVDQTLGSTGDTSLDIGLEWSTMRRLASNYKVSVRLLDPNGDKRASVDTQPGYGFAPTSLWRPGERVGDRYVLQLPDDLPPGDGYRFSIIFYQASSLAEVARAELGPFRLPLASTVVFEPRPRSFELPSMSQTVDAGFFDPMSGQDGDLIRLAGYDMVPQAESLDLTLWWVAQRQPRLSYTVFVHLFDPADETKIITQFDAIPRGGSHPTLGWLAGEVVSDTVQLSLGDVPPGPYRLAVGLYNATTGDRLAVATTDGELRPDRRLFLPDEIIVNGQ